MDEQTAAEISVQGLLLRVVLTELAQRNPAAVTAVRDALEQHEVESPAGAAVLARWTAALKL